MLNSIWDLWPWISLGIFTVLVKWFYRMTHGQVYMPLGEQSSVRPASDGIGFMLLISLVLGAAVCVLIDNGF